jgi:hypothetical protein
MGIYRMLCCGQPIKRREYLARHLVLIVFGFLAAFLTAYEESSSPTGPVYAAVVVIVIAFVFAAFLNIFWMYWRIRDCVGGRNAAALAFLASVCIPLAALAWYFWPSRAIPPEDG